MNGEPEWIINHGIDVRPIGIESDEWRGTAVLIDADGLAVELHPAGLPPG